MKNLTDALEKAGQSAVVLDERILITPFGGRILGLFPDGTHNLLWVTDDLETKAAEFFRQDGWKNIGGDRTWISPEKETNGNPNMADDYNIPPSVDAGAFNIKDQDAKSVTLTSAMHPAFRSIGREQALALTKRVEVLDGAPLELPEGVHCAGYTLNTKLEVAGMLAPEIKPAAWNILQVPGGGDMIIPTKRRVQPMAFIGTPSPNIEAHRINARVDTDASFKFGLHVDDCSGKMLYLKKLDCGQATLILRTLDVHAADRYADVPADHPEAVGYIQQFYVDDGALGGFGELEYHTPYLTPEQPRIEDRSEVWGFVGPTAAMDQMVQRLTG